MVRCPTIMAATVYTSTLISTHLHLNALTLECTHAQTLSLLCILTLDYMLTLERPYTCLHSALLVLTSTHTLALSHAHIHTHTHTHLQVYTHEHSHKQSLVQINLALTLTQMHTLAQSHSHILTFACWGICKHTIMHTDAHINAYTKLHTQLHMHSHILTHMHTYVCAQGHIFTII